MTFVWNWYSFTSPTSLKARMSLLLNIFSSICCKDMIVIKVRLFCLVRLNVSDSCPGRSALVACWYAMSWNGVHRIMKQIRCFNHSNQVIKSFFGEHEAGLAWSFKTTEKLTWSLIRITAAGYYIFSYTWCQRAPQHTGNFLARNDKSNKTQSMLQKSF